jgi:hypothetical protein
VSAAPRGGSLPEGVDHLLYAVTDLEQGRDEIERLLGVRPARGGRHLDYGTHNALLSLGDAIYLEVIAPDPELPEPARGPLFDARPPRGPHLASWVLRRDAIDEAHAAAGGAGVDLGRIESGGREQPDGSRLTWRLSDPYAPRLDRAVPFLIAWGDTPHPAATAPRGGALVGLRVEHPAPERVRGALAALEAELEVVQAVRARLIATIETGRGRVELR